MASLIHTTDRIEKLNGNNYRSWKLNMKMLLVQCELWKHVAGEASAPIDKNNAERFNRKEKKALAAIALNVEAEQQIHILDCETAYEARGALKKVFEPKSRPRILHLRKQMVSIKLEADENMTSYLGRIKICSDGLKDAGYKIKDDDIAYTMLSGLPDSYEGIVMTQVRKENNERDRRCWSTERSVWSPTKPRKRLINHQNAEKTKERALNLIKRGILR